MLYLLRYSGSEFTALLLVEPADILAENGPEESDPYDPHLVLCCDIPTGGLEERHHQHSASEINIIFAESDDGV